MDLDVFSDPFLVENPEFIDYDITLPTAQATDSTTQYQHASGTLHDSHHASLAFPPAGPSHTGVDTSKLLDSPEIVESFPIVGPQSNSQEPLTNMLNADPGLLTISFTEIDASRAPMLIETASIPPQVAGLVRTDELYVDDGFPHMPFLDSTFSLAPFEMASTAFDQRGLPAGSGLTQGLNSVPAMPSQEVQTEDQSQIEATSTDLVPGLRYVPLKPKAAAAVPQDIEKSVIEDCQGPYRPAHSSPVELEARSAAFSSVKGKRKRSPSPKLQASIIPKDRLVEFSVMKKDGCAVERVQQPSSKRRNTSAKACLRCRLEKLRCSGNFPCDTCEGLLRRQLNAHARSIVNWKSCVDADILQLNFISEAKYDLYMISNFDPCASPGKISWTAMEVLWERAHRFTSCARHLVVDSGISHIIGFQMYRSFLASRNSHTELSPPFFWMLNVLPWEPLKVLNCGLKPMTSTPSFARVYVATILQPEVVTDEPGIIDYEKQEFVRSISVIFFTITDQLLKRARLEEWTSLKEEWATLNENLTAICFLTAHCDLRKQMLNRGLAAAATLFPSGLSTTSSIERYLQEFSSDINNSVISTDKLYGDLVKIEVPLKIELIGYERNEKTSNKEKRVHLREYAQHWLKKLGEGPDCYNEVMLTIYDLNILCRMHTEEETTETEKRMLGTYQRQASVVFDEAVATFRRLALPQNDAPEISRIVSSLSSHLDSIVGSYIRTECHTLRNDKDFGWPTQLIHLFETQIADLRSQGRSDQPGKGDKVVAPKHDQEFAISLSPRVAQDLDGLRDYYQSRVGFLDRLREIDDAIEVRKSQEQAQEPSLHTAFSLQE